MPKDCFSKSRRLICVAKCEYIIFGSVAKVTFVVSILYQKVYFSTPVQQMQSALIFQNVCFNRFVTSLCFINRILVFYIVYTSIVFTPSGLFFRLPFAVSLGILIDFYYVLEMPVPVLKVYSMFVHV